MTPTLQHSGPPPDSRTSVYECARVCVRDDKDGVTFKVPRCQLTIQTRPCISTCPLPPPASLCLSFLSPASLLGAALPFPSPPLLLSSPPVSPSLPLLPYGTHYKRCRFSPPTFLRAFHHSLTLHQPCAPLSLFTLLFIVSLSFVISLLVFFLTFQYPVPLFYFPTCR